MLTVFVLQHSYPKPNGEDETKMIGVYATRKDARLAIRRLRQQPGFKDTPRDFYIDAQKLNEGSWTEGFICMVGDREVPVRRVKTGKLSA
jgi:hypothetical protein